MPHWMYGPRITAIALLATALVVGATATAGDAELGSLLKLSGDSATLLTGNASVTQKSDGDESISELEAAVLVVPEKVGENGVPRRLAVLRSHVSRESGDGMTGGVTRRYVLPKGELAKAILLDEAQELEVVDRNARIFFPLRLLPDFALPAAGEERTVKTEVPVLGQIPSSVSLLVKHAVDENRHTLTRTLAPGEAPKFEFRGSGAKLTRWVETWVLRAGHLELVAHTSEIQVGAGVQFIIDNRVTAKRVVSLKSKNEAASDATSDATTDATTDAARLTAFADLERLLRSSGSSAARTATTALVAATKGTDLELLGTIAETHLAHYEATYELTDQGRILGRLMGKAPPDFSLADLEGKTRRLADLIKGKVAYLNFWGVG